jgi:arginase
MLGKHHTIHIIGSASGVAAGDAGCADGPETLKNSPLIKAAFHQAGINVVWDALLRPAESQAHAMEVVTQHCLNLATAVAKVARDQKLFVVFGGDHSGAVGTWSGAYNAVQAKGDLGLIWIDAHMDSHTPESSHTGNIHGMPVACLLGEGTSPLTRILSDNPKIKPEHLCLIGVRSYEPEEAALLKKLKVRVYMIEEVERRGLTEIIKEAHKIVTQGTVAFGLTIDIDSLDPLEAPGTGVKEPGGLSSSELCNALTSIAKDKQLIGVEIVEFDPHQDRDQLTEKIIARLIKSIFAE